MSSKEEVWSESQFIYTLIKDIVLLPITLILVISKQKEFIALLQPLKDFWTFLTGARMTFYLILINVLFFIIHRLILYLSGFGIVNNLFVSQELINFQVDNLMLLFSSTLFEHPKFIISFLFAGFTHGDTGHLIGNIIGLFIFGRVIEKKLGQAKVLMIYLVSTLVSSLIVFFAIEFIFGFSDFGYGASLALFAFIAVAVVLSPFYITYRTIIPMPIIIVSMGYLPSQLAVLHSNILSRTYGQDIVAALGHLAAFFIGFAIILFLYRKQIREIRLGIIFSIIAIVLSLIIYFVLGTDVNPVDFIIGLIGGYT